MCLTIWSQKVICYVYFLNITIWRYLSCSPLLKKPKTDTDFKWNNTFNCVRNAMNLFNTHSTESKSLPLKITIRWRGWYCLTISENCLICSLLDTTPSRILKYSTVDRFVKNIDRRMVWPIELSLSNQLGIFDCEWRQICKQCQKLEAD